MSLWSHESERFVFNLSDVPSPVFKILWTPSIATSGKLIIGVEMIHPIVPTLETVKVAFCTSFSLSCPFLALEARSESSSAT